MPVLYTRAYFIAVIVALAPTPGSGLAADPSGRDIMEKNFYATKISHLTNDSVMTLVNDKGQQRIRKMHAVSVLQPNGIDTKLMIRFQYPADVQGSGYLQVQHHDGEDDMWIYLPALKKVRRLVANNKKDSFVGSDFSYGDILLPTVDVYRRELLRSETVDGEDCYVVESVPASEQIKKDYGYSRWVAWIRKSNFMEKKTEYYDTAGRLLKTQTVPEVKEVDAQAHRWWAVRREVINHQTGHHTLLVFENLDATRAVPEDFFTPRYLEREK
jgi:uncharacterized protein